ncbi:Nucleoside diphosphate kinase A [Aphelenchoides bicaudatus]|nr:Nucleoside diphosphate kinase A [Aphelenchoides bicaudatus]
MNFINRHIISFLLLILLNSIDCKDEEECSSKSDLLSSAEMSITGSAKSDRVQKIVERFEQFGVKPEGERTLIAIKPDGVQRGLVGKIIQRFENRGFKLVAMKMIHASKKHLETHYSDLKDKPFFASLIEYVHSGPVVAMVWEGLDVIKQGRNMLGATNPLQSAPGTIRGDFCLQAGRNIIHGSDSVESATKEINHWFKASELVTYDLGNKDWIYE